MVILMKTNFEMGMVTEVNGNKCIVTTFDNMNHSNFIVNGEVLSNPKVNSFLLIKSGFEDIVAQISSETIWDNQYSSKNFDFDDRYIDNQVKRTLEVKIIGTYSNNKFNLGISKFPMIGDSCEIPTTGVINAIYVENSKVDDNDDTITIGASLNESYPIELSINSFFASHIGIFGNTGSGKSNTLNNLYFQLFNLRHIANENENLKYPNLTSNSSFLVIDYNGEYIHENSFGVSEEDLITKIEPSPQLREQRIKIHKKTFLDIEILSILFSATPQTQRPFLHSIIKDIDNHGSGGYSLSNYIGWIIKEIYEREPNADSISELVGIIKRYFPNEGLSQLLGPIESTDIFTSPSGRKYRISGFDFVDQVYGDAEKRASNYHEIKEHIRRTPLEFLKEFQLRCHLKNLVNRFMNRGNPEFIIYLLNRIDNNINELTEVVKIMGNEETTESTFLTVVSLNKLKGKTKNLVAMLVSKMFYDKQKDNYSENSNCSTNIIIDEAHNILAYQPKRDSREGEDYQLKLFEEIIKEGRKFGCFLTIASQRPSDISPTIISQIHNFFIHKLVNDRDLKIINYSLSTLDSTNRDLIPTLAPGNCVVTGTALNMPVIINVDFVEDKNIRPQSDTINLISTWRGN